MKLLLALDGYLSPDIDLITIQLGENVSDRTTYKNDYISLIEYVKENAPNARIIIVDDFWRWDDRFEIEKSVSEQMNVEFVILDGIADNSDYFCGLGTTVYDKKGNPHIVEHEGVATHPNNKGMAEIAKRIIQQLEN